MGKRVLLIGGNFSPEQVGIGRYNGEMMNWLANHGFDCTVITTSPYYPHWKVQEGYSNQKFRKEELKIGENSIQVYRCPQYIPMNPNGKKRLLQDFSFSLSSMLAVLHCISKKKFDYVITVAPPFHIGFHALLYKKLRGAKFFYHVQDLQIEAAQDLGILKSRTLLQFLFRSEKQILKNADVVSTISKGMAEKLKLKAGKEVVLFPNWADIEFFQPLTNKGALKSKLGLLTTDKIVLYSGAVGEKQGLEMVLNSAEKLSGKTEIKFLICGSGPYHRKLEEIASARNLKNVFFLPLQPKETFNEFLNTADLHLVLQKKNASDLVMPSKLTNILAVGGVALVTAAIGSTLHELITSNNLAVISEPEDQDALDAAIFNCLYRSTSDISLNARNYAEENLSIDKVIDRYVQHFI
jgi:colanic acid biosynthesis glycosyl transferase WcaI